MSDQWRSRVLRELSDVQDGQTRQTDLEQERQLREREAESEELTRQLLPGDTVLQAPEGREDVPAFGDSLMRRLAQDAATPFVDAGGSALYSLNLYVDPLQEKNLEAGEVTVGTGWTLIGPHWQARKVLESGDDPVVIVKRTYQRTVMEGQIYRSNVMVFDVDFQGGAGAATIEYRPVAQVLEAVHIDWPWFVAAFRTYIDTVIRPATNLLDPFPDDYVDDDETPPPSSANYVRTCIVDGDLWVEPPQFIGDEHELQKMSDDKQESQPYVSSDTEGVKRWPMLQMRVETTAAGGIAIGVAEPQCNYSYQEAPMPFDPDIGNFDRTQEDIVPGYPGDNADPPQVQGVIATPLYREHADGTSEPIFALSWDAFNPAVGDVMGYEIQWDVMPPDETGTPQPADWLSYQTWKVGPETLISSLSPIIGGSTYAIRMRAYDSERRWGAWSNEVQATALPDLDAPSPPDSVRAIPGYKQVGVLWAPALAPDLSFYQVRWKLAADPDTPESWNQPDDAKTTRLIVDGLIDDTEYEFQVRAIDRSGNVEISYDPGDPDAIPPIPATQEVGNYQNFPEAGWSVPDLEQPTQHIATTVPIGYESIVFDELVANFINTGIISADQIQGGDLRLGGPGQDGTIRIYDSNNRPIGAWGDFGWIIADPANPGNAMWGTPQGEMKFTALYDWDGTETTTTDPDTGLIDVTAGIEQGIPTTTWTTAIGPTGINAEAITFGTLFGGNNRLLNAGFELLDFDVATLVQDIKTNAADFAVGRLTGLDVNLDVAGTEIRMLVV